MIFQSGKKINGYICPLAEFPKFSQKILSMQSIVMNVQQILDYLDSLEPSIEKLMVYINLSKCDGNTIHCIH